MQSVDNDDKYYIKVTREEAIQLYVSGTLINSYFDPSSILYADMNTIIAWDVLNSELRINLDKRICHDVDEDTFSTLRLLNPEARREYVKTL